MKSPMPRSLAVFSLSAVLAAGLAACSSLAPTYERPALPVPATWPQADAAASAPAADRSAAELPWRQFVRDERLRQVIAQALADSRDLRKAAANVAAARALYRGTRAAELPTVTAGVSGSRARALSGNGGTTTSSSYSAEAGLSAYELDLFGRLRSASDAGRETWLASAETARATRITLIAETTSAWLTLAADRSRLAIAEATAESAQRSMALTRKRMDLGVASMVDLRSAETTYQQARADAAALLSTIAQDRNALQLLVGSPVADALLPTGLPEGGADAWLAEVPAGLSSELLLQRPDVLAAEHTLKSANADIGAARAKFFPTLSLTAKGGVASAALGSLFSGGAGIWSLAPSLSLPLFDGGANQANLDYTLAQKQGYVASYEKTVQTAFQEVADALAVRATLAQQLEALQALVQAAGQGYQLADARYSRGVDTFLNALVSQRTLYAAQSSLVSIRLSELDNRVALYRYLGGGLAGETAGEGDVAAAR